MSYQQQLKSLNHTHNAHYKIQNVTNTRKSDGANVLLMCPTGFGHYELIIFIKKDLG